MKLARKSTSAATAGFLPSHSGMRSYLAKPAIGRSEALKKCAWASLNGNAGAANAGLAHIAAAAAAELASNVRRSINQLARSIYPPWHTERNEYRLFCESS